MSAGREDSARKKKKRQHLLFSSLPPFLSSLSRHHEQLSSRPKVPVKPLSARGRLCLPRSLVVAPPQRPFFLFCFILFVGEGTTPFFPVSPPITTTIPASPPHPHPSHVLLYTSCRDRFLFLSHLPHPLSSPRHPACCYPMMS